MSATSTILEQRLIKLKEEQTKFNKEKDKKLAKLNARIVSKVTDLERALVEEVRSILPFNVDYVLNKFKEALKNPNNKDPIFNTGGIYHSFFEHYKHLNSEDFESMFQNLKQNIEAIEKSLRDQSISKITANYARMKEEIVELIKSKVENYLNDPRGDLKEIIKEGIEGIQDQHKTDFPQVMRILDEEGDELSKTIKSLMEINNKHEQTEAEYSEALKMEQAIKENTEGIYGPLPTGFLPLTPQERYQLFAAANEILQDPDKENIVKIHRYNQKLLISEDEYEKLFNNIYNCCTSLDDKNVENIINYLIKLKKTERFEDIDLDYIMGQVQEDAEIVKEHNAKSIDVARTGKWKRQSDLVNIERLINQQKFRKARALNTSKSEVMGDPRFKRSVIFVKDDTGKKVGYILHKWAGDKKAGSFGKYIMLERIDKPGEFLKGAKIQEILREERQKSDALFSDKNEEYLMNAELFRTDAALTRELSGRAKHVAIQKHFSGEELADMIRDQGVPQNADRIALSLVFELRHLHAKGIWHRDIKPENCMCANGLVTMIDFGLAEKFKDENSYRLTEPQGTLEYLPKSMRDGSSASPKSDIYAAGRTLAEIYTGRREIGNEIIDTSIGRINYFNQRAARIALQNKGCPPSLVEVMTSMTNEDDNRRIGADEALMRLASKVMPEKAMEFLKEMLSAENDKFEGFKKNEHLPKFIKELFQNNKINKDLLRPKLLIRNEAKIKRQLDEINKVTLLNECMLTALRYELSFKNMPFLETKLKALIENISNDNKITEDKERAYYREISQFIRFGEAMKPLNQKMEKLSEGILKNEKYPEFLKEKDKQLSALWDDFSESKASVTLARIEGLMAQLQPKPKTDSKLKSALKGTAPKSGVTITFDNSPPKP